MLAYFDSFAGIVPVRVDSMVADESSPGGYRFKVRATAARGAYARGQSIETNGLHVIPRQALFRRRGGSWRILPYSWADFAADAPKPERPSLPVLFRADRSGDFKGDVTAVFPTLPGTAAHDATCYAHIGQHGTCSRGWYLDTRAAKPGEYADLLQELRRIYERPDDPDAVRLVVAKRWTQRHDDARRAELQRMNDAAYLRAIDEGDKPPIGAIATVSGRRYVKGADGWKREGA